MFRFGLDIKIKTANWTKLCSWVKNGMNLAELKIVFSAFGLGWFDCAVLYCVGSVMNTPTGW